MTNDHASDLSKIRDDSGVSGRVLYLRRRADRYPDWFPVLTAIHIGPAGQKGKIETRAFPRDAAGNINCDAIALWTAERNGRANLYYALNSITEATNRKASRTGINRVLSFHVDVDPRVGEAPEQCKTRAVQMATTYKIPPTWIIDSGGGVQLIWDVTEPLMVAGDLSKAEEAKLYNLQLERDFGGDACHNVDRILRLPETDNIPDANKLKKGRVRARARIIGGTSEQCSISNFIKAETNQPKAAGIEPAEVFGADDAIYVATLDELRKYDIAPWALLNIRYGDDVERLHQQHVAIGHRIADGPYPGKRSDARYAALRECGSKGVPAGIAVGLLLDERFGISAAIRERRDSSNYAAKEVRDAFADAQTDRRTETGGRPHILYDETHLSEILDNVESAFIVAGAPIYQTGGRLVHPLRLDKPSDEDGVRRSAGALLLRSVAPLRLREYCLAHIDFTRMITTKGGKRMEVPFAPPVQLAHHELAREDMWRYSVINGITETPTLRADGSLLTKEGFDEASGLLVDLNEVEFPPIPDAPTKAQAAKALATIKELLVGFPFVPDNHSKPGVSASASVAISAILTVLVRRTLRSAPLHGFSAPTMATGKSLLVDVVSMIGAGRLATAMSQGHDETEDEKRLLGVLMRGDLLLLIDNVHRPICGDTLCTIMTQQTWQGRLLGENRQIHVSTNVLVLATGNNLTISGDMTTRTLISRLDAGMEQPETRRFDVDLKVEVPRRRPEIVAAGLTILRAFVVAGRPGLKNMEPFGRFEDWSNLVRGALVWLGEPDPCNTRALIAEHDPVRGDLGALVAAWRDCIGVGKAVSAHAIVSKSAERGNESLGNALAAVMPRGVTTKGVSGYLSEYDGRIIDGQCIRKFSDKHTKVALFRLDESKALDAQPQIPF